jgi:hypothetical protein
MFVTYYHNPHFYYHILKFFIIQKIFLFLEITIMVLFFKFFTKNGSDMATIYHIFSYFSNWNL